MTLATPPTAKLSLEEFLLLPEDKPALEYLDGQIYHKPMPQGEHSTLQVELVSAINRVGKPQKLAYAWTELLPLPRGASFELEEGGAQFIPVYAIARSVLAQLSVFEV